MYGRWMDTGVDGQNLMVGWMNRSVDGSIGIQVDE